MSLPKQPTYPRSQSLAIWKSLGPQNPTSLKLCQVSTNQIAPAGFDSKHPVAGGWKSVLLVSKVQFSTAFSASSWRDSDSSTNEASCCGRAGGRKERHRRLGPDLSFEARARPVFGLLVLLSKSQRANRENFGLRWSGLLACAKTPFKGQIQALAQINRGPLSIASPSDLLVDHGG